MSVGSGRVADVGGRDVRARRARRPRRVRQEWRAWRARRRNAAACVDNQVVRLARFAKTYDGRVVPERVQLARERQPPAVAGPAGHQYGAGLLMILEHRTWYPSRSTITWEGTDC